MNQGQLNVIGMVLAVSGTIISITGALINNVELNPLAARQVWMASNPVFLAYFIGVDIKWWNGQHISTRALIITYSIFTITNFWSLM